VHLATVAESVEAAVGLAEKTAEVEGARQPSKDGAFGASFAHPSHGCLAQEDLLRSQTVEVGQKAEITCAQEV